jgi:hypothetical protein
MATKTFEVPLGQGLDEGTDRIELPSGKLALMQNCRADRQGRLEVRPQNTALGTTTYSSTAVTAFDLANFNGKLVMLGDSTSASRPTDLFELVQTTPAVWRGTASDATGRPARLLPRATAVRETGRLPDLVANPLTVHVATDGTFICAAISLDDGVNTIIHAYNPATDQSLIQVSKPLVKARVVYASPNFWVVGWTAAGNIVGFPFNPASDKTIPASTTLVSIGALGLDLAVATFGTGFVLGWVLAAGTVQGRTFTAAGAASVATITVTANSSTSVACCGDSGGTLMSFAWQENAGPAYFLRTFNAAGAAVVGPTALFGGATGSAILLRLGMRQQGTVFSITAGGFGSVSLASTTLTQLCTSQTLHTLQTTIVEFDTTLVALPIYMANGVIDEFYLPAVNSCAAAASQGTNTLIEQATLTPQLFKDGGSVNAQVFGANNINGSCSIGTKVYWGNLQAGFSGSTFSVTEVDLGDTGRRSMTQLISEMHIAGGLPLVYDGRVLGEHGFAEIPQVVSAAGNTGGAKTLLGVYNVQVVWQLVDSRLNIVRSAASTPLKVTLTAGQNAIDVVATAPHSLHTNPLRAQVGGHSLRVVFFCTTANDSVFFQEAVVTLSSTANYGDTVSKTLFASDVTISANQVVYKQSQTPLDHFAPPPYRFGFPGRERQVVGGLPQEEIAQHSKLLFPSEPVAFSTPGQLGFQSRANDAITAVGAAATYSILFTKREISAVSGRGPERNGTGDFNSPQLIGANGGCKDWRSLVNTPIGFFFQMADEFLMLLTPDQQVQWIGQPVRDTLKAFPTITGAVHIRSEQCVAFACNNLAGTDCRILWYDLPAQQWSVDVIGSAVAALSEVNGQLAFISGGTVFLQDAAIASGVGALPTLSIATGSFRLFSGMGWGDIVKVGLLGSYVGDCTAEGFISYDDGRTWVSLGQHTVTAAALGLVSGDPVSLLFVPARREVDRFALRFDVTNGVNTGGVRLNLISLEAEAQEFMTRQPARNQR